jgi:hypothetical protein
MVALLRQRWVTVIGATAMLTSAPHANEAHQPRNDLAQTCAAARSAAERHRLGCWRLDSGERTSGRPYDADAKRDWEQPRAWERR